MEQGCPSRQREQEIQRDREKERKRAYAQSFPKIGREVLESF